MVGVAIKGEIVKRDIKDMPPGRRGPSPSREFRVRESQDTEQLILLEQVFQQGHNKVKKLQGKYMKKTETPFIHSHELPDDRLGFASPLTSAGVGVPLSDPDNQS